MTLQFIEPGKPVQIAFSESSKGRFLDEYLNENWFVSLRDSRETIEAWRVGYNDVRPHPLAEAGQPRHTKRKDTCHTRCAELRTEGDPAR